MTTALILLSLRDSAANYQRSITTLMGYKGAI